MNRRRYVRFIEDPGVIGPGAMEEKDQVEGGGGGVS